MESEKALLHEKVYIAVTLIIEMGLGCASLTNRLCSYGVSEPGD